MTTATVGKKNPKYKWEVLALLWVAYLLNQADRQVFNVVLPLIREDLGLSDVAIGSIATVFNLFYAVLVPIGGLVGDRFSRKWIVTGSILFWSVATMFTGLCNGFVMLVLMRSVATGGGEAFFGPANYSLLAQYHDKTRAFAMSVHQTAYYIGIIISGYAAGYIGQLWGWRSAFYVFGAVGVVHGVIMAVRLKDKKEPAAVAAASAAEPKPRLTEGFRMVFTTPTALILTVCFAGLIFVLTGYPDGGSRRAVAVLPYRRVTRHGEIQRQYGLALHIRTASPATRSASADILHASFILEISRAVFTITILKPRLLLR